MYCGIYSQSRALHIENNIFNVQPLHIIRPIARALQKESKEGLLIYMRMEPMYTQLTNQLSLFFIWRTQAQINNTSGN